MNGQNSKRLRVELLEVRTAPTVVPVGGEFRVNTYTTDSQRSGSAAMDVAGDFIIAWQSNGQDGSNYGIIAQRYNAGGAPQGPEFPVNTYTTSFQVLPAVAMDAAGDYVVAWTSLGQDGSGYGIYAKRFSAAGVELPPPVSVPSGLGNEFRVNTYTTSTQRNPAVAMDQSGDFVIAWQGYAEDGSNSGVFAQRYSAAGSPQGGEFRVNTYTTGDQYFVSVAMDATGDFVAAWTSRYQDGSDYGVYAQRYDAQGLTQGGEFPVNTTTFASQRNPSVAMDSAGEFVIAWQSYGDGSGYGIYAKRYSAAGTELSPPTGVPTGQGNEFHVSTYTTGDQAGARAAVDSAGDFVVSWNSYDGNGTGGYAQAYRAGGYPDGANCQVNTYTTGNQTNVGIAMDLAGDFVNTWASQGQDGDAALIFNVYAQRYRLAQPPRVSSVQVNDGAAQRSRVTQLDVTFNNQVTFATTPVEAFTLTRYSDGAIVSFSASNTVVNSATVVTLNAFGGLAMDFGSLADGRYTLTALASQISAGGPQLDGNNDGTAGDDYVLVGTPANGLFRLFGDSNGDGTVNAADFLAFRLAFQQQTANPLFDFNGDGQVNNSDFLQFRLRFLQSI